MSTPAPRVPDHAAPILVLNSGSSSIKFALFQIHEPPRRTQHGAIERIGRPDALFHISEGDSTERMATPTAAPDHHTAINFLLDWLADRIAGTGLAAIGHRIVHGGPNYSAPQRIDAQLLAELRRLSPFDPEHLPAEIALIEACTRQFPQLTQIACFDTAFHHTMPRIAQLLPIPRRYFEHGVRRYGFHGLSYQFLLGELGRVAGADAAQGRVILAHLGNGASLAAVHRGQPVDTSMSLTPASGLMMGSRSGDLDPGLTAYLASSENMDATAFNRMVNTESGMLGISGSSADIRDLLAAKAHDPHAAEAIVLFCYQARKWIGAFAAALGGLDTLVFAGGIGEHAAEVRSQICAELGFLGIALDPAQNAVHAGLLSSSQSRVAVRVIRTDEEQVIACAVRRELEPASTVPS